MCILRPDADHLSEFRRAFDQERGQWLSRAPQNWARHVTGETRPTLPIERQDRYALREWLPGANLEDKLLAVSAWGGMEIRHGRTMWGARIGAPDRDSLMQILQDLPNLDRRIAYTRFRNLRLDRGIPGVGPAYFTKMIHFIGPKDGYILDQWTARSVNLLFGPIVHIKKIFNRNGSPAWQVADQNSTSHYERYCRSVEQLASMFEADPSEIESALFARGQWRERLEENLPTASPVAPFCQQDWQG